MKMFQEGSGRERQRIEAEEVVVHKTRRLDDLFLTHKNFFYKYLLSIMYLSIITF